MCQQLSHGALRERSEKAFTVRLGSFCLLLRKLDNCGFRFGGGYVQRLALLLGSDEYINRLRGGMKKLEIHLFIIGHHNHLNNHYNLKQVINQQSVSGYEILIQR